MGYQLFELTDITRSKLLNLYPPKFDNIKCDHVTHIFGCRSTLPLPEQSVIKIIGYASDESIECFVVIVNGSYVRPDGKVYHITISHNDLVKPVYSNELIKSGWREVNIQLNIENIPKYRD